MSSPSIEFSPVLLAGNFLSGVSGSRSVLEDLGERLERDGCRYIGVSRHRNGWLRGADMVLTALRTDCRVAVVDLYSGKAFLWGEALSMVLHRLGRPFILVLRGGGLPTFAKRWPGRVKACLARATAVTVPSRFLLEEMKPYRQDLVLLPNPIHLPLYSFVPRQRPRPTLMWCRAFENLYNPTLAVEVLGAVAREFPDVELTMLGTDRGDGSWQATTEMAGQLNVSDRLHMPGGVPKHDVPAWMQRGDIFLNTTTVDNTPVSVIEAMACGLCIVSTNVGGIPYLLEHDVDALLVPSNDAQAMAAAVRRILVEPGLAERLSRKARRKATAFDWAPVLEGWKELLRDVAVRSGRERAA